jgi:hypothetical protein
VYYEGWSENVLTSAALQSGWPSLRDAERRFYRLRSRTSFPQPAAAGEVPFCLQPTGFSPATPFGDCIGGGDYNHSRDLGIAALFPDDAAYLVAGGVPGEPPWPGAADDPRAAMIADITSSRGLQRAVSFQSGDAGASPLAWGERHYPRGLSAGVLFTPADAYATIDAALTDDPERARVPALRTPDYVEVFGDAEGDHAPQFFVGKFGGAAPWSAVIHTGVIDTYTGGGGAGFGGGALVSLWTAAQGQAIYSWNIGRNYDIDTWFDWSNLWQWPTHAASGRAGAIRFSSAGIGQPAVTSTVTATSAHVEVSGTIAEDATVSAPLAQAIAYARTFDLDEDGVRVTTTLAPVAAAPTVDELYETLPLFSYFVAQGDQTEAPGTASTVEFVVGGVAQPRDRDLHGQRQRGAHHPLRPDRRDHVHHAARHGGARHARSRRQPGAAARHLAAAESLSDHPDPAHPPARRAGGAARGLDLVHDRARRVASARAAVTPSTGP